MLFNFPDGQAVQVNCPDQEQLLERVDELLAEGKGFALATLNVDHLERLAKDEAFRRAYAAHDLVVADGNPVVWLSRLADRPVSLVPGSNLVRPLTRLAARHGAPIALLGGDDASMQLAAQRLTADYTGLQVALIAVPGFPFDPDGAEADALIQQIRQSGTRLCLLGLGAPRQERFAIRARDALPGVGFVSIGAGIDFISGQQQRAPMAVRRVKMEWLWRMLSNPKRLAGRYARGFMILPGHVRRALAQRRQD
ncbi:WecB/TagA/CpsF family glycosyltransferase [Paracoccus tegillarcae]|uniref:Glycosyltransferase n=1 Tax=Paracoccus tegillarcae TaxID=1529068 RepID=A0A2K9EH31_9RHOB|nr:WecB/TagA/CpsF family glycosyltransferase [Paracoccus tegillarcae]AUH34288.1 glycosyltransferase [Paracoccus tegillarcae]